MKRKFYLDGSKLLWSTKYCLLALGMPTWWYEVLFWQFEMLDTIGMKKIRHEILQDK